MRRVYQHTQANRGKPFEDFLKFVHQRYQSAGIACVHKVPTEFIPIRNAAGAVCNCKVEEKSCVDYLGRYKSVPVAIEAKHEEGARIDFSRVEPHQADYMDDYTKDPGAVGIVIVSFGLRRFFAVPWEFWREARDAWQKKKDPKARKCEQRTVKAHGWEWTTPGMASASPDQFHPAWEIKTGGASGLPYLEIIERMKGGAPE
ncbi:MAG: Holliday junction resolvase RecU [Clostridia bacterium]|nr:Holliday junction resolvase RecU [Clostridia bacterium]